MTIESNSEPDTRQARERFCSLIPPDIIINRKQWYKLNISNVAYFVTVPSKNKDFTKIVPSFRLSKILRNVFRKLVSNHFAIASDNTWAEWKKKSCLRIKSAADFFNPGKKSERWSRPGGERRKTLVLLCVVFLAWRAKKLCLSRHPHPQGLFPPFADFFLVFTFSRNFISS